MNADFFVTLRPNMNMKSEKIEKLLHSTKFWQFVRFALNGGLSSAIHYGIY